MEVLRLLIAKISSLSWLKMPLEVRFKGLRRVLSSIADQSPPLSLCMAKTKSCQAAYETTGVVSGKK
jgi:hypothetical protein